MSTILEIIGTAVVTGLVGGAVGYLVRKNVAEAKIATAEEQAIKIIQDAEQESVQSILNMVYSGKKVIITGCLPQKHKDELKNIWKGFLKPFLILK